MDLGAGITNERGNHLQAPPSPALDDSDSEWETPIRTAPPAFNIVSHLTLRSVQAAEIEVVSFSAARRLAKSARERAGDS